MGWKSQRPWKYVGGSDYVLTPKMSHSIIQNCRWITSSRMKDLCQKWKVKLIFRRAWSSLMASPDWPWPWPFPLSTPVCFALGTVDVLTLSMYAMRVGKYYHSDAGHVTRFYQSRSSILQCHATNDVSYLVPAICNIIYYLDINFFPLFILSSAV